MGRREEKNLNKLVIFYSFDGNTRFIAQTIAEQAGADLLELKPVKEIKTHGFLKYFLGGGQVIMKTKPELMPLEKDPGEYDVIFIGTPVWAGNCAPAVISFFDIVKLKGKRIALFCCYSSEEGNTFTNMIENLSGNEIIGEQAFLNPLKKDQRTNMDKAKDWVKKTMLYYEK